MLDIREIEYWISRYENEADKLDQCVTLSALYNIRDKMQPQGEKPLIYSGYSQADTPEVQTLSQYGNSDFLQALSWKDPAAVLNIIDELMDNLQVVNPRVYDSVMRKLNRI